MGYYLIGIGGTGARCMESFIHLNSAGLLRKGEIKKVELIYVDADLSCGNLERAQGVSNTYMDAKQRCKFTSCSTFKDEIVDERIVWNPVGERVANKNLNDVFGKDLMLIKEEEYGVAKLFESLFDRNERNTTLDKGFRGHPAIGATVVCKNMSNDDENWGRVIKKINSDANPKVFLFASVFGGTGASGFPNIARLLKDSIKKPDNGEGESHIKIGGALILPYFDLPMPDDENAMELQAKSEDFMINTKAALDYYDKNGLLENVFNLIYAIGDHKRATVNKFALGSRQQTNDANLVELYAALGAFDFFNRQEYKLENGRTLLMSHGSEEFIDWNDFPSVGGTENLKAKLSLLIKFLYIYKVEIFPNIVECTQNDSRWRSLAWYKKFVREAKVDPKANEEEFMAFKALDTYADRFFSWLYQVAVKSALGVQRPVRIVNDRIFNEDGSINLKSNVDLDKIIVESNSLATGDTGNLSRTITQELVKQKSEGNGVEMLLNALENLCIEGGKA